MLKWIGVESEVCDDLTSLENVQKLVLPGVGAFDAAMQVLKKSGMAKSLIQANLNKIPIFGICLGMQLLFEESEEGSEKGLGLIEGSVKKIIKIDDLKIPHMGWNAASSYVSDNPLLKETTVDQKYYFVHSYHVKVKEENDSIMKTDYGILFNSIVNRNNIFGVQFHPEKSHKYGLNLIKNYILKT